MAEPFNLVYLPEHILIKIFSSMTYSEISKCREVCQTFNRICSRELTKAFVRVDRLHSQIQKNIKSQLPRKESERRNHALSRFVDVLSALETRLSLLSMTYTKYIDLELCCFIPGMVLDELYQLLHRLQNTESQPPRAYDLLQSLRDLSTMAMEHFEEFIVPLLKAQMTERSQSLFFSPASASPSSPLHSSIASGHISSSPLDVSSMSMMDCAWPMQLNTVSSPWRRTPLKLDVQRMQSQMQMHSAAIATMTKEYREQKVKVGEQTRIMAEQERQLQEQRRLIQELKGHMQVQEKNLDVMVTHLTKVTGKVVHLPERKAWDPSLWDPSLRAAPSTLDCAPDCDQDAPPVRDVRPRPGLSGRPERKTRHPHRARQAASTATWEDSSLVEQFMFQANELHQSLSSKCSTKRLLAQIALAVQRITADHSLPVCLEDRPSGKTWDTSDPQRDLVRQLAQAQEQLSVFNEEHVGCSVCSAEDSASSHDQRNSDSRSEPGLPSVANQGLVNRAQELYNKLNSLIEDTGLTKPASVVEGVGAEGGRAGGRARGR
ncbi:hypothetical protein ACOMHN_025221 [Nucella lapillus]